MKLRFLPIILSFFAVLTTFGQPEYSIENNAVTSFLADRTYEKNTNYSTTVVTNYNSSSYYSGARHRPVPVTITWTRNASVQGQSVIISANEDYSSPITFSVAANATSLSIYNLLPNVIYYYKVVGTTTNGTSVVEAENAFRTAGQVRMIYVDGVNNVRDLGGWPTSFGTPVKYERVYRGANLDAITPSGRDDFYGQVGVRAELDLRRADETTIKSSPLGPDVNYIRTSTTEYYNGMANQPATLISDFKWIVENLRQGRPVMFHCLIGADRTGTLAFMQEGVLGLNEANLCRDYELTTFSVSGNRLRTQLAEMVSYVKTFGGNTLQQKFYNYLLSKGMTHEELDDYIAIMLDNYTVPKRINTEADQYKVKAGDTILLKPSYYPVDYSPAVVYTSSNTAVATVTPGGEIIAKTEGQAIITIAVGFHTNISTQVLVTVEAGRESAKPTQITIANGNEVNIYNTIGENIVRNGSFEYPSPFALWTTVNNEQISSSHFKIMTDKSPDGKNYLQSQSNGAYDSPASIVRSFPVVAGKTYAFGYRIKNADGVTVTNNPDIKLILKPAATASGSTDDFDTVPNDTTDGGEHRPGGTVDDFIIGSNAFVGSVDLESQELPHHPSYNGDWTPQNCVFTVPEGYTWLEMRLSNLASHGGATCFDQFFLVEVQPAGTVSAPKSYLNQVVSSVSLTNFGKSPLQHPEAKAQEVNAQINEAVALLSANPSAEEVALTVNKIRLAQADFLATPLNTPAPQQCYLIVAGNKVLTPANTLSASFSQPVSDNVDQGFRFLFTTEPDVYIIEHPLDNGTSLYLTEPSGSTFSLTSDIAEAAYFRIGATTTDGLSVLYSEGGYESPFQFSIEPDYGIINAVELAEVIPVGITEIFTTDGKKVSSLQNGLNIIRYSNGASKVVKISNR